MSLVLGHSIPLLLEINELVGLVELPKGLVPILLKLLDSIIALAYSLSDDLKFLGLCRYEFLMLNEVGTCLMDIVLDLHR